MFLVLAGYYLLKTAREIFILSEGGAEVKSYSSAGQALMLLVLVPAYGAFASRGQPHAARAVGDAVLRVQPRCVFLARAGRPDGTSASRTSCGSGSSTSWSSPSSGRLPPTLFTRGAGQAALPADRRRQQPGRVARLGPRRPARGIARARRGCSRGAVASPRGLRDSGACHRPRRQTASPAQSAQADEKLDGRAERLRR